MKHVLVTYDTRSASTAEISHTMSAALAHKGYLVDVRLVDEVNDVTCFDIIVVGSPIRLSKCTRKVRKFVRKHLNALSDRRIAFFFTCMSVVELKGKALPRIPVLSSS